MIGVSSGARNRRLLSRLLLLLLGRLLLDALAIGAGPLHTLGRLAFGGAIGGRAALGGRGRGGGRLGGRLLRLGRSRRGRRGRLLGRWCRLRRGWRRCGRFLGGRGRLARASRAQQEQDRNRSPRLHSWTSSQRNRRRKRDFAQGPSSDAADDGSFVVRYKNSLPRSAP